MKKLILSFLGIAAIAATTFTSCKKDEAEPTPEETAPTISVLTPSGSSATIAIGGEVAVSIKFDAATDQKLVTITKTTNRVGVTFPNPFKTLAELSTYTLTDTLKNFTAAGSFTYTYTIADKNGHSNSITIGVTVTAASTALGSVKSGTFHHIAGLCEGSYDLVNDVSVSNGASKPESDMVNTDASGSFNGSWTVGTGNTTLYVKAAAGFDYANATVESVTAAYNAGTGNASVSSPAIDDIYVALLRNGKYAVIKITKNDKTDTTCSSGTNNLGVVGFNYKKEQ